MAGGIVVLPWVGDVSASCQHFHPTADQIDRILALWNEGAPPAKISLYVKKTMGRTLNYCGVRAFIHRRKIEGRRVVPRR